MSQWLLGSALIFAVSLSQALEVTDYLGNTLKLKQPAERIISLTPHITELLFSVGAGEKIVGTVEYSDYPDAAKSIPQVGNYAGLNIEAILALQPDLIIYWPEGNSARDTARLQQLKLPLFASDPNSFTEIADDIKRFGALTGYQEKSTQIAHHFLERVNEIKLANQQKKPLQVFFQVWDKPLLTQNGDTFISRLISLCGGKNIFSDLTIKSAQVSVEAVLTADPDIFLAGAQLGQRPDWLDEWLQYPYLTAVKTNQLLIVEEDLIHRPTLRLLDAAQQVCILFDEARAL